MFSLGIVILNAATLNQHPVLYDWNSGAVCMEALDSCFRSLGKVYCAEFVDILKEMLSLDPK